MTEPSETTAKPSASDRIESDARGAMKGGEAQRGDPATAPLPLGRKDPTTTGRVRAG